MPRAEIAPGEYYHIFNRGVHKNIIFFEDADYIRMLFVILAFQARVPVFNIRDCTQNFLKSESFKFKDRLQDQILQGRAVELSSFILMPNHFHLLCRELEEGGIVSYLQRIEIAYTKYINIKYKRSGYLFQGPFQSVHIKTNEQLLHLSAYIHRNIRELPRWKNKEHVYPWSSYQDYLKGNRWEELLKTEIVSAQFNGTQEYKSFVDTSGAKDSEFGPILLDMGMSSKMMGDV